MKKLVNKMAEVSSFTSLGSELRAMCCEQSLLNKADGSASFSQGHTQVLASAYGPVEVKISKELIDQATVEVIFRPKVGQPGCNEKFMERVIRNSCAPAVLTALHPRSSLTIIVQVVQNSGSLLSCTINAACLAMLDAGFPMKSIVCAVACALKESGEIQLDPTQEQEKESAAVFTFAFDSISQNVVTSSTAGSYTIEQYNKCLAASRAAASNIFEHFRLSVERKLSKDTKNLDITIASS